MLSRKNLLFVLLLFAVLLFCSLINTKVANAADMYVIGKTETSTAGCILTSVIFPSDATFTKVSDCQTEIDRRAGNHSLWYKSSDGNSCLVDGTSANTLGKYASYTDCTNDHPPTQKWQIITDPLDSSKFICGLVALNPAAVQFDSNLACQVALMDKIATGPGIGPGKNPCVIDPTDNKLKCQTAIGNIPADLAGFATNILSIAVGIAGGIAFILMVIGAIRILTSQGDPKGVAGGREMMVAAVAGLLFLIFSVILLRFIGINLLGGVTGF